MWNVRRRIDLPRLPPRRVVVRFEFRAFPPRCRGFRTCWLILERDGTDLCLKDPGFDVDLVVTADAATIARVWTGHATVRAGGAVGRARGARALATSSGRFPSWLLLSHFAHVERPARAG